MSRTGAGVVAAWAAGNAALTVMLVLYGGPTLAARSVVYGAASGLVLVAAVVVLGFRRGRVPRPDAYLQETEPQADPPSGAPALAAAGACLVGGLAWVFGVYLAYLAAPLLAYAVGKWIADSRATGAQR